MISGMSEKDRLKILGSSDILKDKSCALLINDTPSDAEIRNFLYYFANELNIRFEKIILVSSYEKKNKENILEYKENNIISTTIDYLIENIIELLPENISAVIDATQGSLIKWSNRKVLATKVLNNGISYIGSDFAFFPRKSRAVSNKPIIAIYGFYDSIGISPTLISILKTLSENKRTYCIIKLTEKGAPHPRVVNSANVKSSKELLNLMRHRNEEDQELILESAVIGTKIIGCISIGEGMTGKPFYSLIDDSLILANSFEEQVVILETANVVKPISITDLNIISITNDKDIELDNEIFLESKISNTDLIIFTENIDDNIDKNRYRKIKRKLKENISKTAKFINTISIPLITKDISEKNVLLIKGNHSASIKTFSNYIRKRYKPKSLSISMYDINKKTFEKITKTINEKKIDILIIEYGKIDIGLIRKVLSMDLEVGFLYYELNPDDRILKASLKKSVDLAFKRFNLRISNL